MPGQRQAVVETQVTAGGPGREDGRWLAEDGYAVHLIDLVALHARAARHTAAVTASVGDARRLPAGDGIADAVLMLGPLYHLTDRADRLTALREAARATRPGGMVLAAGISRSASLIDMAVHGLMTSDRLPGLLNGYATGRHDPALGFTTAYFHSPGDLTADFIAAGLPDPQVFGIEGPMWAALDAANAKAADPIFTSAMVCARAFETDPAIIGARLICSPPPTSSRARFAGRVSRAGLAGQG